METLNLPTYSFSIKSETDRSQIFDAFRRKYVILTPEEWVRQHFLHYLAKDKMCPSSLIAVEAAFRFNKMMKRTDILVHNRQGEPLMIVECKSPSVNITASVFEQIGLYNLRYHVPWLVVTNGMKHYCCHLIQGSKKYEFTDHIPDWEEMNH